MKSEYQIMMVSESCLLVKFGDTICPAINRKVRKLSDYVEKHPFPGFVETVVSYTGLAVLYDPWAVQKALGRGGGKSFQLVGDKLAEYMEKLAEEPDTPGRVVEIPVCYGEAYGPDLEYVASFHGLTPDEVVDIHCGSEYLCYMIGFCPGFPYLGGMDERIATPRRETPRLAIPARSIGIAGSQTGGYPISTPGGWQLIGRSAVEMYDPTAEHPSLLQAGDIVRFRRISPEEYREIRGDAS